MGGKKRGTIGAAAIVPNVPRVELVSQITEGLSRGRLVSLVADCGMGKHYLANQVMARARVLGQEVRVVRYSPHSVEGSYRRLRRCSHDVIAFASEGASVLVVVEDLPDLEDTYLGRTASVIESMALAGVCVLLLMEPSGERILEEVNCGLTLRARDLVVTSEEFVAWSQYLPGRTADTALRLTRGAPMLLGALRGTQDSVLGYPEGAAWGNACESVLAHAVCADYIDEEAKLRCGMLALGEGGFDELRALGIRVSLDMLRQLELDAPLLGVCARERSFSLFGCAPELIGRPLRLACARWPWLVSRAVKALAERGDFRRAGLIALACPDYVSARRLAIAYPVELIDAGMATIVLGCVSEADGRDGGDFVAAREALRLLGLLPWGPNPALGDSGDACCAEAPSAAIALDPREKMASLHVRLLEAVHDARTTALGELGESTVTMDALVSAARASGDRLSRALACHARVVTLFFSGAPLEAFRELILGRDLRERVSGRPSLVSAMLQHDFEMMRRLVGDSENPQDRRALKEASVVLAELAPEYLRIKAELMLDASAFVIGTTGSSRLCERVIATYSLRGEYAALTAAHVVAAFSDISEGFYRRAFVHVAEGRSAARTGKLPDALPLLDIATRLVAVGLGESPENLARCAWRKAGAAGVEKLYPEGLGAISKDVAALGRLHAAVWTLPAEESDTAGCIVRDVPPRALVVTLAALVGRVDRVRGTTFMRALPAIWRGRTLTPGMTGAGYGTTTRALPAAVPITRPGRPGVFDAPGVSSTPLRVNVLGGFWASLGGNRIPDGAWHRRHARSLLAMLALTPGHSIARFEAAESFWPDSDYARCRAGMYTVVSSLRGTLGQVGASGYLHGEMGRLWLDGDTVSCDIDEFEELAREVIAQDADDAAVISACTRMEEMYQGGTTVAATDPSGFFRRRHEEVSRRYVDSLLAGVSAAIRLGDARQAVWFAESARAESPDREDVIIALGWAVSGESLDSGGLVGGDGGAVSVEAA